MDNRPASSRPGRALGIDPGTVRIGVAVSDPDRLIAAPLDTLVVSKRDRTSQIAERLVHVARDLRCTAIIVGLPLNLAGKDTKSTTNARALAAAIKESLNTEACDVILHDERLSSVSADRALAHSKHAKKDKRFRDQAAATVILQDWLDSVRTG